MSWSSRTVATLSSYLCRILYESIASILNTPQAYGIRMEFLDIEMSKDEQVAYFSTQNNKLNDNMIGIYDSIQMIVHMLEDQANNGVQELQDDSYIKSDELIDKPRNLEEIAKAIEELLDKIWFDRHLSLQYRIDSGLETVAPDIWEGALKSAQRVIEKYGEDNLGPYSDFEWGMLNGKLSALRWVLGDEWDMLDT